MRVPAVVAAGDRRAARAVHGESKPYLALAGRPLVAHVVELLQDVPEVSEVWVVGDAARLERVFADPAEQKALRKPLHVVPQHRNLYENAWETYRRLLPGAGPEGRDPAGPADETLPVLYLSADLPFATPEEVSAFVRQSLAADCDYAVGLCGEEAMADFYPEVPGAPGIRMAYFNLREGRFRQNNLHLVRPALLGNRHYIEDMYEHRYQKQFGQMLALGWRLLRIEEGGPSVLYYYVLMHLAGIADRRGWRRIADWLRNRIPIARVEKGVSGLLRTRFRFVITDGGGCAVDLDNEEDYESAKACYERWVEKQRARVARIYAQSSAASAQRAEGERSHQDASALESVPGKGS
ncbi:MAG TPA: NTP transferase domain-containing protein [Myxococcota bacterium]|nr:NTP transferase domain-containing protein [Myxococcota bacterium]